jgi:membrane protein
MAFLLPGDVATILAEHATRLTTLAGTSAGAAGLVSFALVVFSASSGLMALCDGLNVAFERVETRSLVGRRSRAIVLTLASILFLTILLVVLDRLQEAAAVAGVPGTIVSALRWPLTVIVAAMALATLYHYGPDRTGLTWQFFTIGSVTAAILWVAASHVLAWYLATFPGFGLTYGSLAVLAGFLFWVWLSTIVAVIGAELDAILERGDE